jgi:hypothetical protein
MYGLVPAIGLLSLENHLGKCQCFPNVTFLHLGNIAKFDFSLSTMTSVIFFADLVCSL